MAEPRQRTGHGKASPVADRRWMEEALALAVQAEEEGEVPVGALVVRDGKVLGRGWNQNITLDDPTAHAEILAIREAAEAAENHRLTGATLYVTLEPCAMCAGAMIHARIARLVFGARDPKTGVAGGVFNLFDDVPHNHRVQVEGGCQEDACSEILQAFFRARR